MEQVLMIAGVVVAVWFAIAVVVALGMGRAVRIADDRQRAQVAYRRASSRTPARPVVRTPARAH